VIMSDLHSSCLGGHLGAKKLADLVSSRFFWVGILHDCTDFVATCSVCQRNKIST